MPNTFYINKRDMDFVLFEQLRVQDLQQHEKFGDFGQDEYDMILTECKKFCEERVAPLNTESDRVGVSYDNATSTVTMPPGFVDTYKQVVEQGWMGSSFNPEFGGQGLPSVVAIALSELFGAASMNFAMTMGLGVGVGHMIENFGTEPQQQTYVEKLYTGEWNGAMVLTEPGAGSALGDMRTTATKVEGEDYYLIEGTKCFITNGEHDLTDNIIHAVLAKIPGGPPGTKGLGLFICPKYFVNDDGSLGDRNDWVCAGVEEKMGLHGSPTCVINYGEKGKCIGWLVGPEEFQGMRQMFQLMNEARIATGMQGVTLAGVAYENAKRYAQERIQGTDIKDMGNKDAPRVPIIRHGDVRRMLMLQKSHVEGMRALAYMASHLVDKAAVTEDPAAKDALQSRLAVITPLVKAYCSDKGVEMTSEAIQVFGGYGYCGEYPVEQYMRDARIAPLYEGTNFIQSADLVGRKLNINGGATYQALLGDIDACVQENIGVEELTITCERLREAHAALLEATMELMNAAGQGDFEFPMSVSTRFLHAFAEVVVGWQLLVQARIAHDALQANPGGPDATFYQGKVLTARFFAQNVLPDVRYKAEVIKNHDTSVYEMAESAF